MWYADCCSRVPGHHLEDEEETTYAMAHTPHRLYPLVCRTRPGRHPAGWGQECLPRRDVPRRVHRWKEYKLVYDVGGGKMTRNVPVSPAERARYALADDDILTLARWARVIEDHYSTKHGCPTPMD